ncbi:MAG: hypothetical protein M1813_006281 [Trichoglossum hirsutum]|nr:MAG: hypothetical protein M1813_006281 [Trichoglossum hirsutum]
MTMSDSDSSIDDAGDYTETNVLLGYASKESTEDSVSQLGGYPTWLDPNSPPPPRLARCKTCNDLMVLLLQINGDLPLVFPGHERRLYVFACRRKTCRRREGSVRALRGVRVNSAMEEGKGVGKGKEGREEEEPEKKGELGPSWQQNIGESLFGGAPATGGGAMNPFSTSFSPSANPFSTTVSRSNLPPLSSLAAKPPQPPSSSSLSPSPLQQQQEQQQQPLSTTFASKLKLGLPTQQQTSLEDPWPPSSELPPPYPTYYLDADYETLDNVPGPSYLQTSLPPLDPSDSTPAKEDKTVYESPHDKPFHHFASLLSQNPLQVLRYEFRGKPLLYSKTDAVGRVLFPDIRMPRCVGCGEERVFELQLTPRAIAELEVGEEGFDGMEWGTVVVGVCGKDCVPTEGGEVGYLEEWAGVQWEELGSKGG